MGLKTCTIVPVLPDFRVQAFTLSCTLQLPGFFHCTQFHVSVCMEFRHKCDSIESLIHELVSIDYVCVACVYRRVSVVRSLCYFPIHRAPQSIAHKFFCIQHPRQAFSFVSFVHFFHFVRCTVCVCASKYMCVCFGATKILSRFLCNAVREV